MPKLPHPAAEQVIKLLSKNGFITVGRKGSHIRMKKKDETGTHLVVVPDYREIAPGTLLIIIRRSGIDKESFLKMLNKL